jgi:hypothetical protein
VLVTAEKEQTQQETRRITAQIGGSSKMREKREADPRQHPARRDENGDRPLAQQIKPLSMTFGKRGLAESGDRRDVRGHNKERAGRRKT